MSTSAVAVTPPGPLYPQAEAGAWLDKTMDELRNPADLGFPPMLPLELAMKIDTPQNVFKAHGITDRDKAVAIAAHPVFVKAYQEAVEMLKVEGMSFKLKARMQAEHFLTTSFAMVTNPAVSDAVRADLIKSTVRWAGLDQKAADTGGGSSFNIQINLG